MTARGCVCLEMHAYLLVKNARQLNKKGASDCAFFMLLGIGYAAALQVNWYLVMRVILLRPSNSIFRLPRYSLLTLSDIRQMYSFSLVINAAKGFVT